LVCQKQLRKALLLVLVSVSDCKRLETRLYFIIINFLREKTLGQLQSWYEYSSIYTVHNVWPINKPCCFDQVRLKTEVG